MPPCTWIDVSQTVSAGTRTVDLGHLRRLASPRRGQFVDGPRGVAQHADRALDQRKALGQQVPDGLVRTRSSRRTASRTLAYSQASASAPRGCTDEVSACDGQRERMPAAGVLLGRAHPSSGGDSTTPATLLVRSTGRRLRGRRGRLATKRSAPQVVGEHRAEERDVDQSPC